MPRLRSALRRLPVAAALASVVLALVPLAAQPAAAAGFCGLTSTTPMTTYRWTGAGDGTSWNDGRNWDRRSVPGLRLPDGSANGYVCITGPVDVRIRGGESAHLHALDLDGGARLTVEVGGKLFLEGNPSTLPSITRLGTTLALYGSTLGGRGALTVAGFMQWRSTADGAATQTTRECDLLVAGCTDPATGTPVPLSGSPGRTTIATTGVLTIDGRGSSISDLRGVNLFDKRIIDSFGTTTIANQGYVAADYGTVFRIMRTVTTTSTRLGVLRIANNLGYYQGRQRYGIATRSLLYNDGLLAKSAGSGTSVIDAAYAERSGRGLIRVDSGALNILGNTTQTAAVRQGTTYASAGCAAGVAVCTAPDANASDSQTTSVTLPSIGTTYAQVSMQEMSAERPDPNMMGVPVHIATTGFQATAARPMAFRLRLDQSIVRAGVTLGTVEVLRRADNATVYTRLANCTPDGKLPAGVLSCLDRAASAVVNGDFLLVVRTTQNSRYMAR